MTKTQTTRQKASNFDQKQKHKAHKTIREKLRKKRQQQKQHLKQKRQHKKQYNPQEKKHEFFEKNFSDMTKKQKGQFKYKKMKRYIQKFINMYEDDLEDFFQLFKQLDEGGFIDISDLENKKMQKLFKKIFRYLPLNNNSDQSSLEFQKRKQTKLCLQTLMRNLVSEAIERYLQNGTDVENQKPQNGDSSDEDDNDKKANKKKSKKSVKVNIQKQDQGIFTLPIPKSYDGIDYTPSGPSIPQEQRQKIALLFEQQVKQMEQEKQELLKQQDQKFDSIFSSGSTANKLSGDRIKRPTKPNGGIEQVPDELMAEGSAKIGQKVPLPDEQDYDSIHRPKKLIEQHQEMMAMNRGQNMTMNSKGQVRRPFDRQRDIVNSQNKFKFDKSGMKNGVFFDFKDKMSAPKKTNNFL